MFRIPALPVFRQEAKRRAKEIGSLNGSIRQGAGNYVGCLFEVAHRALFGGTPSTGSNTYHYDLVMDQPGWLKSKPDLGCKIDCKTKERTLSDFNPLWDASVADHAGMGTNQSCDVYAFGSVSVNRQKEPTWIWFCGIISKDEYYNGRVDEEQGVELDSRQRQVVRWENKLDGAEFRKKGLPYDNNGFKCREDCWNRPYTYLHQYKLSDANQNSLKRVVEIAKEGGYIGTLEFMFGKESILDTRI